jgi:hypothetical protein
VYANELDALSLSCICCRYFLEDCETNSQNYLENQTIQVSDSVQLLANETENKFNSKM